MHNFRDLKVWKKSFNLTIEIYKATKLFPKEETFGLRSQLRRAAVSIPSNIAEGCGRGTDRQLIQFLNIAQGSACEVETQLLLSGELEFISEKYCSELLFKVDEVQKMLRSFKSKLS